MLEPAVMAGPPRAFMALRERVGQTAPVPVAEAVRERRLVRVGGEKDTARRCPRVSLVLPPARYAPPGPVPLGARTADQRV